MKRFSTNLAILTVAFLCFAQFVQADVLLDPTVASSGCPGEEVSITATGCAKYKLYKGSTLVTQSTDATTVFKVYPTENTTYKVVGYDGDGFSCGEKSITVSVASKPTVSVDNQDVYVKNGDAVTLKVNGANGVSDGWTWTKGGSEVMGASSTATKSELTITPISNETYSITLANAEGCESESVEINVHIYDITATPAAVCEGEAAVLTVTGASNCYWSTGATGNSITVYPVNTTVYTVEMKDSHDSKVGEAELTVTVNKKPKVSISPDPAVICNGDPITLMASTSASPGGMWTWSTGETGSASIDVSPATTSSYWVTYTDVNGCTSEKVYRTVTVNTPGIVSIDGPDAVCVGQSAILSGVGGTVQRWYDDNDITLKTTPTYEFSPSEAKTYTIYCDIRDAKGCVVTAVKTITANAKLSPTIYGDLNICQGENATLTVSTSGASYLWSTGETTRSIELATPGANVNVTCTVTRDGCSEVAHATVKVNKKPTITILTTESTICKGNSATLTASAKTGSETSVYSYVWDDAGSTESNVLTVAPEATKTYTVTVTDLNTGCSNTKSITITVDELVTPSIVGETSVCPGVDFTLSVSLDAAGTTYEWNDDANSTTRSMTDNITEDRTYQVVVKYKGCTYYLIQKVTVKDGPTGAITGKNQICAGSTTELRAPDGSAWSWSTGASTQTITVSASGEYSVLVTKAGCSQLFKTNVAVNSVAVPSITAFPTGSICSNDPDGVKLTAPSGYSYYKWSNGDEGEEITVHPSSTTTYTLTVTDAAGCTATASHEVKVYTPGTVNITGPTEACPNVDINLSATGGSSWLWTPGGQTTSTITVAPTETTTYSCEITDDNGCVQTVTHTVTVNSVTTPNVNGDLNVCKNGTATVGSSIAAASYEWRQGSAVLGTNPTLTLSNLQETKDYKLVITDAKGCKAEKAFTITVNALPSVSIEGQDASFALCSGSEYTLTANASAGVTAYKWSTGETTQSITITRGGNYTVEVTGVGGCVATASQMVTEKSFDASISGAAQCCKGSTISLTANGGDSYLWDNGLGSTATVNVSPTTTTIYWVTITKDGCEKRVSKTVTVPEPSEITVVGKTEVCVNEETTLTANLIGGTNFYWEGGPSGQSYTIKHSSAKSETYTVHAKDANGCDVEQTVTVESFAIPTVAITGENQCCKGSSITLKAVGTGITSYKWSTGETSPTINVAPTVTTTYTVIAYNALGCPSAEITHTVTVNPLPLATITGPDQVCSGSTATLTANGGTSFRWSTGETTQSITPTIYSDITYTCAVTDANGCTVEVSKPITIYPAQQVIITGNSTICAGETATLTASGVTGATYNWSNGVTGATINVTAAGEYKVVATYGSGCTSEKSVSVVVNPTPTIEITTGTGENSICPGQTITLTATAGSSYLWTPGNLTTQSIDVSPNSETKYTVVVTDANGCAGTASKTISIKEMPTALISGPVTSCAGAKVTLTATGGTVLWHHNSSTLATIEEFPTATTTYYATITGANGCPVEKSWTVTINAAPTVVVSGNTTICYGESTTLTASGAQSYVWDNGLGAGESKTISPEATTTYHVVGTDANGCSTDYPITVTVNPLPVASIEGPKTVCEGEEITLKASGGTSYRWSTGDTGPTLTVKPTAPSATYTLVAISNGCESAPLNWKVTVKAKPSVSISAASESVCAGEKVKLTANGADSYLWSTGETTQTIEVVVNSQITYSVTGTTEGCSSSATKTINVITPPTIVISGDLELCVGEATTLTASGAKTYEWSDGLGTGASVTVSPTVTTVYEVTGIDANGCKATKDIKVTVYPKPVPSITGTTEICAGETTTLSASTGKAWKWNTGETTQTIEVDAAGTYTVLVTGDGGCTESASIVVSLKAAVDGSIAGPSAPVCQGTTVTLTANGGRTYKWDDNGSEGANLVLDNVQSTRTYWVTITGESGCTQRLSYTLTVKEAPSISISGNTSICAGGNTTLTAVSSGAGLTYLWSTGETKQSITVSEAKDYDVTVTDAYGCSAKASVTVTQQPLPVATINISSGTNTICEGSSVTLTATGGNSYVWSTGETSNSILVTPIETTTYKVTPTVGNCTGDPTSVTITVNPKPVVTFLGDTRVCYGEAATISADGADTYVWSNGRTGATITTDPLYATTTLTVTATNTSTNCSTTAQYTVIVNDKPTVTISGNKSVCAGEATTLTATAGDSYRWYNGKTDRNITLTNLLSDEPVWVEVTKNGCVGRADAIITVNPIPTATIETNTGKTTVCAGESIKLTATGGQTYLWQHDGSRTATIEVSPTQSTTYTVTVYGTGNCSVKQSINIEVLPLPKGQITSDKTDVCAGEKVTLTVGDGVSWQWYQGSVELAGETNQYLEIASAPVGTTTYKVRTENTNGCSVLTSYTLTVKAMPDASITGPTSVCAGSSVTLSAPDGCDSYMWNNGKTTKTIEVSPSAKTDYTVTITKNGCTVTSDPFSVNVNPLPVPSVTATDLTICAGNSTTLSAGTGFSYYKWSTGQQGASMSSIGVSPTENTTYTVEVTDNNGCTGVGQVTITVNQPAEPTINVLSGSNIVCAGEEVILQASTAKYYDWSTNVGLSQISQQVVVLHPTKTSTYTVTTTDKKGCSSSKDITITVKPTPTPKIIGEHNICKGSSVTLTASSDVEGATYKWSNGSTEPTITVTPSKSTTYYLYASNGTCENTTPDAFTVTVNDKPAVSINNATTAEVCAGEPIELTAMGGNTFLWSGVEGAQRTLKAITVTPTQTTVYTCSITDANGCTADASITVNVNSAPKATISGNSKICAGETATLIASGGSQFLWDDGRTDATITVTPLYTTTYTCEVKNAKGCVTEAQFTVEVIQKPKVRIDGPSILCSGTATTLSVVSLDGRTYTCRWKHNNSTNLSEPVSPLITTTYTVEVFDGDCSKEYSTTVTVVELQDPIVQGNTLMCLGDETTLTVQDNPSDPYVSYEWSTGEKTQSITVKPSVVGQNVYKVTVRNSNDCEASTNVNVVVNALPEVEITPDVDAICYNSSITLTASGAGNGGTYNWYQDPDKQIALATGTSTYTLNNLTATTTVYATAVTKQGCESEPKAFEAVVTALPNPVIDAAIPNGHLCNGSTVQLNASDPDPDVTFVWNDGTEGASLIVDAAGSYTVTATNKIGCTRQATYNVTLEDLPEAKIVSSILNGNGTSGTAICAGTLLELAAEPQSSSTIQYTYLWNTGSKNRTIQVNPTANTTYSVKVTSSSGCVSEAEIEIKVNEFVEIEAAGGLEVCDGAPYILNATGSNLTYYEWTRNGERLTDYDGQPSINCLDTVPDGQTKAEVVYGVKALYDNNCETEKTVTVVVYANPKDLSINGIVSDDPMDSVCLNSPKQLSVMPMDGSSLEGVTYTWTGAGITDPTAATQTITPTTAGIETYNCQLVFPGGCTASLTIKLKAIPLPVLSACADTTICIGGTAQVYLKAKENCPEGTIITWSSTTGGGGSGDFITVTPNATTEYVVTAKTPMLECLGTDTVVVKVIPVQTPVVTPDQTLLCLEAGVSTTDLILTSTDTDTEGRLFKSFNWYRASDPSTSIGTASSITVAKADITATETYVVEVETEEGCKYTGQVEVPVSIQPSAAIKGEDKVCAGKSIQLEAINMRNVSRFEWTTNANPTTPFATTASVVVFPTDEENTYYLTVYNDKDCKYEVTPAHVVNILQIPSPQIVADNNPVCAGSTVVLTASDLNGGTCTYVWDDGSTNPVRTVTNLQSTTIFSVVAKNENGCEAQVSDTVYVNPLPKLSIIGNTQVCVGDSVLLEVHDANGDNPLNSYHWSGGSWQEALDRGSVNNSKVWVKPTNTADSTEYTVYSTDYNTCEAAPISYKILAYEKPIAMINGSQVYDTTICVGQSIVLQATGGTKFMWNDKSETASIETPVYTTTGTRSFDVTVYNEANCFATALANITVAANPAGHISIETGSAVMCANSQLQLKGSDAPGGKTYEYEWSSNTGEIIQNSNQQLMTSYPTKSTTYTLIIKDVETGCEQTIQQIITVNPQPDVVLTASADTICEDDIYTVELVGNLNFDFSAGDAITWEKWSKSGLAPQKVWTNQTSVTDEPVSGDYIYKVSVVNAAGCIINFDTALRVNRTPKPALSVVGKSTNVICKGEAIQLKATTDEGDPDPAVNPFKWYRVCDDCPDGLELVAENALTIDIAPEKTTSYIFVISSLEFGCERRVIETITVNAVPEVTLTASHSIMCEDETLTLKADTLGGEDISWFRFVGGTQDKVWYDQTIVEDKPTKGVYLYRVVVTNRANGCPTMVDHEVIVNSAPALDINFAQGSAEVCEGTKVVMRAKQLQDPEIWATSTNTCVWKQGDDTLVVNNRELTVEPRITTTYTFVITDVASGCERSIDTTIVVLDRPKVELVTSSENDAICEDDTYVLTLNGVKEGESITWKRYDQYNTLQETWADDRVALTDQPGIAGTYRYIIKVDNGVCDTTIEQVLLVSHVDMPTIDINNNGGKNITCSGEPIIMNGSVSSGVYDMGKTMWCWLKSTPTGCDTISKNQRTTIVYPDSTTTYMFAVIDLASGCVRTADTTIIVNQKPSVGLKVELPAGARLGVDASGMPVDTICQTESINLRVSDLFGNPTDGLTIYWKRNSVVVSEWEGKFDIMDYVPSMTEEYQVTVSNGTCNKVMSHKVVVSAVPDPSVMNTTGQDTICEGNMIQLSAKVAQNIAEYDYLWTSSNPSDVIEDAQLADIYVYPSTTTTYRYTVTNKETGCSRFDTIQIVVRRRPQVSLNVTLPEGADGNRICLSEPVVLKIDGDTTGLTAIWRCNSMAMDWNNKFYVIDTPTITGVPLTYTVELNNSNNCPIVLDTTLVVNYVPNPKVEIQSGGDTICIGQSVTLAMVNSMETGYDYRWSSSNRSEVIDQPTNPTVVVRPTETTTYTYTVTNSVSHCTRFDTIRIIVNKRPDATLDVTLPITSENGAICGGEPVVLRVNTLDYGKVYTRWYVDLIERTEWANMLEVTDYPSKDVKYEVLVGNGSYDRDRDIYNGCWITTPLDTSITVKAVPSPALKLTKGSTTICAGEQITIEAEELQDHSIYTYKWLSSNALEQAALDTCSGQSITVIPSDITTYSYVISDPKTGCSRTGQLKINVNKKPYVWLITALNSTTKDTLVCSGESISFRVDGDLRDKEFAWYKNGLQTMETGPTFTDVPEEASKYYVLVEDTVTGCKTSENDLYCQVDVNKVPVPSIELVGAGATNVICKGTTVTMTAKEDAPHDGTSYSYKWMEGSRVKSVNQSLTVKPEVTTTYSYIVQSLFTGCVRRADTTIYVNEMPLATLECSHDADEPFCAGDPITFSVVPGTGTNAEDLLYTWVCNGYTLPDKTSSITLNPIGCVDNVNDSIYNIECVVQNKDSYCAADPAGLSYKLVVSPLPVPTISAFDNNGDPILPSTIICPLNNVRLQGTHLSGKFFKYDWYSQRADDNITESSIPNEVWVAPTTTTTYTLVVTNTNTGCSRTTTTTINVLPVPQIKIVSSAKQVDGMSVACVDDSYLFQLEIKAADGSELTGNYVYDWYEDGMHYDMGTGMQYIELDAQTAYEKVYTAEVRNASRTIQCPVTATHTVRVMEAPTGITIDAYVNGNLIDTKQKVCSGSAVKLVAANQPNLTYEWSDNLGTIYSNNNTREFVVNPQQKTIYTCKITNMAGCSYSVSRTIEVNPLPTVTVTGPTSFCLEKVGEQFTLTATSSLSANQSLYVWEYNTDGGTQLVSKLGKEGGDIFTFAPPKTGEYVFRLYVENATTGCRSDVITHVVNVVGVPVIGVNDLKVVSTANGQACINTPIEFKATPGYTKYVFGITDNAGSMYQPKQESDLNTWNTIQSNEGVWYYYCDFYNAAGCMTRQVIPVTVNRIPDAITITASGTDIYNYRENEIVTICQGNMVTLSADATGTDNTYAWRDTDGKLWGTTKTIEVTPQLTTEYQLTVTNQSGCQVYGKFTVKVIPQDKLVVTASKTEICQGESGNIQLRVTGSTASLYTWSSDAGEIRTKQPSSIQIPYPSEDVTWYVEVSSSANADGTNCKSIGSVQIEVIPIPNNNEGSIKVLNSPSKVCAGSPITLTVEQKDASTCRWSTGEIKPQITVLVPNYLHDTVIDFWAIGRNSLGCENTADTMRIQLTVVPQPDPEVVTRTVCFESEKLRLEAGDKGLTYRWIDENNDTISRKYYCEIQHDTAGIYLYKLVATNSAGCESAISVVVTVIPFTANPVGLTYLCSGSSTEISVEGCTIAEGYQFKWTYGGILLSTAEKITVSNIGTYYVEVTTPWMTKDIATIEIRRSETPTVQFASPSPACQGDPFITVPYIVAAGTPTNYSVTFNDAAKEAGFEAVMDASLANGYLTIAMPSTAGPGKYEMYIILTNANGCQSGEYKVSFNVHQTNMIAYVYDDVMVCKDPNHEYTKYQWYKNNERITGATMQYYSELGGFSGEYFVIAYKADGTSVAGCVESRYDKQNVSLSPNPLKRNQHLKVEVPYSLDVLFGSDMEVVDAIGRVVYHTDKVENENSILCNFAPGIYMVRIQLTTGELFTEKFVVQ